MEGRGIMGPKRSAFSPKVPKKDTPEVTKSAKKHPKKVDGSKIQETSSSSKQNPQGAATNANPNRKKTNSSSEPSSLVPASTPTPIPIRKTKSQPTTPSSNTNIIVKRIDNHNSPKASPKISSTTSGSGLRQKDVKTTAVPNSAASSHTANDLGGHSLRRLSFDGKDVEDILQGNSIYDLMGTNDKKEESSPRRFNTLAILQSYQKIASHRQGNLSVERYFKKLKKLWDDIETYNSDFAHDFPSNGTIEINLSDLRERDKVMQFFVGLNDYYSIICSQLLLKRPFPTVKEAYSEIVREGKRRDLVVALGTMAAKAIQSNWLSNGPSNNNGDNNNNVGIDEEDDNSTDTDDLGSP